jgi:polyribonucleotide nucleotidyltransferase
MNYKKFDLILNGKQLAVEIRNLAEQANADALIRMGDTLLLTTCVMSEQEREGADFFPLTVNYEEKYYAAGKIKGSRFVKRMTRPSDEAVCNSRLIDRAIRPRFPKDFKREVQVITTVLSWDEENDPDILGLISASIALCISDIPWQGPIGVVRIARIDNRFVLNPDYETREKSDIDLVLAGIKKNGKILINMVEGDFKEVKEDAVLEAVDFSKGYLKQIIDFQENISREIGKQKIILQQPQPDDKLKKTVKEFLKDKLEKTLYQADKTKRVEEIRQLKEELIDFIKQEYDQEEKTKDAGNLFQEEISRVVRENILQNEKREDNRALDEIRNIGCETGILPRAHGSAIFSRGQTKSLSVLTLGGPKYIQIYDEMEIVGEKRFMHHYNFPPYSAGEVKPLRGPGRREIGHGMLAERAISPLLPSFEDFPYAIRIVSEILSSNGSTSMASVSSSSLALMDGGIKIKRPAAGIAIGLVTKEGMDLTKNSSEKGDYKILTDIQGPEDHYGDMDLKVAGTKEAVTAIQMDVKIEGITDEIFKEALVQAKKARLQILEKMEKVMPQPRENLSQFAPRVLTLQIDPEKIRQVIGPGGKTINEIIEKYEVSIDVQQSGLIYITSDKEETAKKAISVIKNITKEVKVGEVFQGRVTRILDFGAFVEILPGQEGLLHISQLAPGRVKKVEDVVKKGNVVPVKVISIDEQGRIDLSLKAVKEYQHKKHKNNSHKK